MPDKNLLLTKQFAHDSRVFTFCFPPGEKSRYIFEAVHNLCTWDYSLNKRVLEIAASLITGAFVDVGANIGTDTVFASEVFKKLFAFEMDSSNVQYLKKNLELNQANCTIIPRPVAEVSGQKISLKRNPTNMGGTQISYVKGESQDETIETIALSDYDFQQDISFLHIDTEGMDAKVLLGAAGKIQKQGKTPIIKFEFSPAKMHLFESSGADLIKFFEIFDYKLFMPAPVQLAPLSLSCLLMLFEDWKSLPIAPWMDLYAFPRKHEALTSALIGKKPRV